MECQDEVCEECKRNCQLIHGKRVSSFFKVMFGNSFSKILFFPPRFARSVTHLINRETDLVDSSGQRWRVTVCNHSGSLAIRKGWHKFSSDHGLNVGNMLVFHYVQGEHFVVQIYGTSGCQQMFYPDIRQGKKRARTYPEATSLDELLETTDISPLNKKRKRYAASESEKVIDKLQAANTHASTGKGRSVHPAENVDESFCMIDRDVQYDQGDNRLCLHLSSFERPVSKPLTEVLSSPLKGVNEYCNHIGTNLRSQAEPNLVDGEIDLDSEQLLPIIEAGIAKTDMVSRSAEDNPLLGQKDENNHLTGIISTPLLKPAGNGRKDVSNVSECQNPRMSTSKTGNHMVLQYENEGQCTGSNQITREKSTEASQFIKETRQVKKEFAETAQGAHCPARVQSGKDPASGYDKVIKSEAVDKVVKSEPVDSGDLPSLDAVSYSRLLELDGRDFLVLPESWRKYIRKRAKMGRWIIFLRGPDKRIWPTFYRSKSGVEVLTRGWKNFKAAYGLNPGDECLFQLANQLERTFDVLKVQSKMPEATWS